MKMEEQGLLCLLLTAVASTSKVCLALRRQLTIIWWLDGLHLIQCTFYFPITLSGTALQNGIGTFNNHLHANSNPRLPGLRAKYWMNSTHSSSSPWKKKPKGFFCGNRQNNNTNESEINSVQQTIKHLYNSELPGDFFIHLHLYLYPYISCHPREIW